MTSILINSGINKIINNGKLNSKFAMFISTAMNSQLNFIKRFVWNNFHCGIVISILINRNIIIYSPINAGEMGVTNTTNNPTTTKFINCLIHLSNTVNNQIFSLAYGNNDNWYSELEKVTPGFLNA